MQERQFSKVFSLLVLVDHFGQLIGSLGLLSDQLSLEDNVELASLLSLLNHILTLFVSFLLEDIQELLST
jgi:hypothetical protein